MPKLDEIEKLITNYNRRLQKLKEQKALYGISVDPKIPLEIEDIEAEIAELQAELQNLVEKQNSTPDPEDNGEKSPIKEIRNIVKGTITREAISDEDSLTDQWYRTAIEAFLKGDYWEAKRYLKMVKTANPFYPRVDELLAEIQRKKLLYPRVKELSLDKLRDPVWGGIAGIVAVLALGWSVYIFIIQPSDPTLIANTLTPTSTQIPPIYTPTVSVPISKTEAILSPEPTNSPEIPTPTSTQIPPIYTPTISVPISKTEAIPSLEPTHPPEFPTPIALLVAPELLEPDDNHSFSYSDIPVLKWSHPDKQTLEPNEYYLIIIPYKPKNKPPETVWYDFVCTITTSWSLAEHKWLLDESNDGQFSWSVTLIRLAKTTEDKGCNLNIENVPEDIALSLTSEKRWFTWKPKSKDSGNGDSGTTGTGGITK